MGTTLSLLELVSPSLESKTKALRKYEEGFPLAGEDDCCVQRSLSASELLRWCPVLSEAAPCLWDGRWKVQDWCQQQIRSMSVAERM